MTDDEIAQSSDAECREFLKLAARHIDKMAAAETDGPPPSTARYQVMASGGGQILYVVDTQARVKGFEGESKEHRAATLTMVLNALLA